MDQFVKENYQKVCKNILDSLYLQKAKGNKGYPPGTVRTWNGKQYKKDTMGNWNYLGEEKEKKDKSNNVSVADFIERETGLDAIITDNANNPYSKDLGKEIKFKDKNKDTTINTRIRNEKDKIILTIISSRKISDETIHSKGTGLGTKVLNSLKKYADKTKKELVIPDSTKHAKTYWDNINWLKRDYSQYIDFDGEPYNPPNTYSYNPNK